MVSQMEGIINKVNSIILRSSAGEDPALRDPVISPISLQSSTRPLRDQHPALSILSLINSEACLPQRWSVSSLRRISWSTPSTSVSKQQQQQHTESSCSGGGRGGRVLLRAPERGQPQRPECHQWALCGRRLQVRR